MTSRIDLVAQNGNIGHAEDLERQDNLETLARMITEWPEGYDSVDLYADGIEWHTQGMGDYDRGEWEQARKELIVAQKIDEPDHFPDASNMIDMVNHPAHYQSEMGIECIMAIRAQMTADQFAAYCQGNIVKYLWRWREKGGVESLKKAKWYLYRMIAELEDEA